MSATDQLGALRMRSRELLRRLEQHKDELERVSGRKTDREEAAEERRQSGETVTRTGGERGTARAGITKPTVRFADTCERQTGDIPYTVSTPSETVQPEDSSHVLTDDDKYPQIEDRRQDAASDDTQACLTENCKEEMEEQSQVAGQSDKCGIPDFDGHHFRPLLGYDWIAGVLDAENDFMEQSDEFFDDLRVFRSTHKDECVHSPLEEISVENPFGSMLLTNTNDSKAKTDTHQCTFSYRINSRLFPVPLNYEECCSVCKMQKDSHPHTVSDPANIRVSIPRSTLLPPYKYKAHRRCSFECSDSLGLPSHCLLGQSHTVQSTLPPPGALDLQSNLNKKSQNSELEDLILPKMPDQMSSVSKLPRHNFQHFSPRKKLGRTPMC